MAENLEYFDWNYYLEKNEDLCLSGINSRESALNHWINNGKNENRSHKFINNDIDLKIYIEKIKYLLEKEYITKEDSWNLVVIIYDKLYNNPCIEDINYFDWIYYIKNNTDLYDSNILSKEDAIHHWNNFGKYENRNHRFIYNILNDIDNIIQNYLNKINKDYYINEVHVYDMNIDINKFDWKYYIKNNKDLIESNIFTKDDAINHWSNFGKYEKRLYRFEESDIKNEENIKDEIFKKEILNVKSIKEETIKKEILKGKIINEETIKEETIKEETITEETIKEDTIKEETINEKIINEKIINDKIINEENINEETIKKEILIVKTINEGTIAEENINERNINEKTIKEKNFKEKTLKKETIKEEIIKEETINEETNSKDLINKESINEKNNFDPENNQYI